MQFMDNNTKELLADKLSPIVTNVNFNNVHINKSIGTYHIMDGKLVPYTEISNISLNFKDGTSRKMGCDDAQDIAKYFGIYLNDKSFRAPEIQPFLTDEIKRLRAMRVSDNVSTNQYAFFGTEVEDKEQPTKALEGTSP